MNALASIEGFWFLPNSNEAPVAGILDRYRSGELRLRLFGWLFPNEPTGRLPQNPDIILGDGVRGECVTLVNCFVLNGPTSRTSDERQWLVNSVFGAVELHLGQHIRTKDAIRTNCIEVGFPTISRWRIPRREHQHIFDLDRSINISRPRSLILYRSETIAVAQTEKIRVTVTDGTQHWGLHTFIEMRRHRREPLDSFRQAVLALEAYLSFITREKTRRNSLRYSYGSRRLISPWVGLQGIWAAGPRHNAHDSPNDEHMMDGFFTLREVHTQYQSSLATWLDNYEEFFPVYVLFLSALDRGETLDQSLFSLVLACDAFYRRTSGRHIKLNHIITEMTENSLPAVVRRVGDTVEFGKATARVRSYYAHYEPHQGSYPISLTELADTWKSLRLVFEVNVLKWMKIPPIEIESILQRVWEYSDVFDPQ
ncbi:MAG TPA: HEPN domain-containing protein [Dongiaceae bacterium]|jgi:hypothetical protein|nr:HEPN domain-containing protein [Dongiaceae bacterium]